MKQNVESKSNMNKKTKLKIFACLSIFIAIVVLLGIKFIPTLHTVEVPKEDVDIGITQKEEVNMNEEELEVHTSKLDSVQNILLIGVDEGGYDNARSDVMIVATVDSNNKLLKLTSVMRDTLSYIPTSDTYQKLNHSYMEGGPVETMKAINMNLDLNIKNFVVFDYNTVMQAVDFVGGYPVYVNAGEAKDMGIQEGHHTLTGENAINYMRVRYNSGGDPGRNQRQRDLIFYIMECSKDMGKKDMLRFASKMMPIVRTSYSFSDIEELIDLYVSIKDGIETEQYSFPFDYAGTKLQDGLWYAVPRTMRDNVITLQNNIFGSENYVPSKTVDEISEAIEYRSGIYNNQQ